MTRQPKFAKVSEEWIEGLCANWPDDFHSFHLHTLLVVANCAAQEIVRRWNPEKGRGEEYWAGRDWIPVNLKLEDVCLWCGCDREDNRLRRRMRRLSQPIGSFPPPLKDVKIWPALYFGDMRVSFSVDTRYAHCPKPFTQVDLPVPIGSRWRAIAHLRSFVGKWAVCDER